MFHVVGRSGGGERKYTLKTHLPYWCTLRLTFENGESGYWIDCNVDPRLLQSRIRTSSALLRKHRWLVTDELVDFEKEPVEVGDLRKIIDHLEESMEYTSNE